MASITASTPTSSLPRVGLRPNGGTVGTSSAILGLPVMAKKGRVTCSMKEKPSVEDGSLKMGMGASLMAAACAATMSSPAMALVDERMSTEGTGLPFGLSNNTLGWILFGVFGLIWALYFVYTATLEEDEESGLSL
ncbi:photosystem II reaction center W protein, chloroplastic-like [Vitis riparia]|uniref:PSII 6.1 kDa protein n=2 Tax=Vitis vinifera TaxID=29760 RepID=A0A438KIC8_VITVI|eukprot:XP_002282059.1 PREDICTED: photosystem II reaction center W protein, chloroplastic [Vitis vinifera]